MLELTPGRHTGLEPKRAACALYPEEIVAFLGRSEVAAVEKLDAAGVTSSAFREPDLARLIDPLIGLYLQLTDPMIVCFTRSFMTVGAAQGLFGKWNYPYNQRP
ncbi:hypothetical protein [Lysobacter capsici]|uniref:hypothetical protein n=1 Tax=Lysobacter capsici TaxID=435897 RepID=UPI00287B7627|nr:hypothetical protein [Lysobacter capsici]WND81123.1 hypothetical protein RJ610_01725 [Lysobacter capsici]WND86319.1 hypothetical protein RJ609_01725 [Lysobacter capsici]